MSTKQIRRKYKVAIYPAVVSLKILLAIETPPLWSGWDMFVVCLFGKYQSKIEYGAYPR